MNIMKKKAERYNTFCENIKETLTGLGLDPNKSETVKHHFVGLYKEDADLSTLVEKAVKAYLSTPDGAILTVIEGKRNHQGQISYLENQSILAWEKEHHFVLPVHKNDVSDIVA